MSLIQSRAMLANLSISQWNPRKKDAAISNEVAASKGATPDAGAYTVKLSDAKVLSDITTVAGRARKRHYELSLPWIDGGGRILSSTLFFQHVKDMNLLKGEFTSLVARLCQEWPSILAAEQASARLGHGRIFDPAHYPTLDQLKASYSFKVNILPMPDADDFRVEISEEEEARIRESITEQVADSLTSANKDAWQRLYAAVGHLAERLGEYSPGKRLHETTIGNLVELVDILPGLNIMQDKKLDELAQEARERLCKFNTQELKDSASSRSTAVNAAQEILDKMKDFCA